MLRFTGAPRTAVIVGASLGARHGIFRWQPTAEFSGPFEFTFVQRGCDTIGRRVPVRVVIEKGM